MEIDFPSEEFIESYLFNKICEEDHCQFTGFYIDTAYRQPDLGSYGYPDIVTVETHTCKFSGVKAYCVNVIELKNVPLKSKDFGQLKRYMKGISDQTIRYSEKLDVTINVNGILAGLKSTEDDFCFLADSFEDIDTYQIGIDVDTGFKSSKVNVDWHRTGKSFKNISKHVREYLKWQG